MRNVTRLVAVSLYSTCSWAQTVSPPFPNVDSVVGAADYSNAATVGIPQGSIFTITGTELSTSTTVVTAVPLPTDVSGLSVQILRNGNPSDVVAQAPLLYVSAIQINAILPSFVPVGQYVVRVATTITFAGYSQPFNSNSLPVFVTSGRFAPFTRQGRGFGPAAIQQLDGSGAATSNQFTAPASPGAVMTLWGTGLGALATGSDANPPPVGNVRNDVTVYVGGVAIQPFYAGRAPSSFGVDQINFKLPAATQPGCHVPVQVATGAVFSGVVTVSISDSGTICPSEFGLSPATLALLDSGDTIMADVLSFGSTVTSPTGTVAQTAEAWRAIYDASTLSAVAITTYPPIPGSFTCTAAPSSPPQSIKGLFQITGVPTPSFSGPSGCSWSGSQGPASCVATSFAFGSVHDVLPQARSPGAIVGFSAQRSNQQFTASWSVSAEPTDTVTVSAGSHYSDPGLFGADSHYYSVQSSCAVSPRDSPFTFPAAASAQAFYYATPDPTVMTLTARDYKSYPGTSPPDLVILVTDNSVTTTAAAPN